MIGTSGWLIFFLINGLAIYSSWCLGGRLLRREDPLAPALVAAGLLYFAHITLVVLFLGVAVKWLNAYTVGGLSAALSAALIVFSHRARPAFVRPAREGWRALFGETDYFLYALVGLFVLQVLVLLAKVIVLPPHIWDVFTYHLPPAVEWYQQGRIPLELDVPVRRMNSQTLGMTVLAYWYFIFLRDDMLVELPQFLWALMLVPTAFAAMRAGGVQTRWAAKFALVIFFVPIVIMQAVTAKDHLGLNVGFFAALLFMVYFLRHGYYRYLMLSAVAFGLMLGYKLSGPIYPLISGVIFLWLVYRNRRQALAGPGERAMLIKAVALGAVIMTALGGYWYIKNLALYGDLQGRYTVAETREILRQGGAAGSAEGAAAGPLESITQRFRLGKLADNVTHFIPRTLDYQAPYGADLAGMSGFGPQFAAFGFLGLGATLYALFAGRIRRDPVNLIGYAAVAVLLFYFLFYFTSNSYRLFSFFAIMMIAYAAISMQRWRFYEGRASVAVINTVMAICVVWNIALLLPPHYTNYLSFREFASLGPAQRTTGNYTKWFVTHRPNMYRLISEFPADVPLAYVAQEGKTFPMEVADDTWLYPYYDRHWERRLTYINTQEYLDCNEKHICEPKAALKSLLKERQVPLLTACESNLCLRIRDPDFFELTPGLYYFKGGEA